MNEIQTTKNYFSFVIGASLVLSFTIFGLFYYYAQSINTKDILSVTGSAKTQVTSDQAKLVISLSRMSLSAELSKTSNDIQNDLLLVEKLLTTYGLDKKNFIETPLSINQIYDQNSTYNNKSYQLNQTIIIQSDDVNKLTEISKKIPALSNSGSVIAVQSLEYYYSKLPDLRVSLLTEAVKDAKARAEKIALGTGRSVGSIQTASAGVVQVLNRNSVDVSDYGNYDTSVIEKDVMVTVKASFRLK